MDITELKSLIQKANENFEAQKAKNEELATELKTVVKAHDELQATLDKLKEAGDADGAKQLMAQIEEIQDELSDVRSKMKTPISAVTDKDQIKALQTVAKKAVGAFVKSKNSQVDFIEFVQKNAEQQCKTLNISSPETGGLAVAEILSRDVMDYYRDVSPIIGEVGRKSSMTRDYRQMIRVSWPSVAQGIENVAGTVPAETGTQEYVEVKSKEFKMYASPRITNEALSGVDVDVYSDLISSLGEEMGVYLANQILYGNGADKNCRGILSSNRFDITNLTGESFKPTLDAVAANRRSPDFYPAYATGVSGAIGADDKSKVNWLLTFMRKLPKRYRANAKLYMNENTLLEFELLRDANDKPVFRTDYMDGEPRLNGKPVVIDDTLPDIAVDSAFIIYGDLPMAFAINDGDVDQLLLDPYTKKGSLIVYSEKEMFEMCQRSDAILIGCATTNALA